MATHACLKRFAGNVFRNRYRLHPSTRVEDSSSLQQMAHDASIVALGNVDKPSSPFKIEVQATDNLEYSDVR
jgi:hypothetical protein